MPSEPSVPREFSGILGKNWVQIILSWPRVWFPVSAGLVGLAVFCLGLFIAWLIAFEDYYLRTRVVWAACVDISWVLASVYWGLQQLPCVIDDLGLCFEINDYAAFATKWKRHFLSNKGMLICGGLLFAIGSTVVSFGMFNSTLRRGPHVFPPYWYDGDLIAKFALILTLGLLTSVVGGSGVWLFLVNVPFLRRLRKLAVISVPTVLIAKLRVASDFYVISTMAWFVAVGLAAAVFFPGISDPAFVFLLITSVIGLSAFMLPQAVFHVLIVRSRNQVASSIADSFHHLSPDANQIENVSKLPGLDELVHSNVMWVFDRNEVTALLIPQVVAIATLALKSGLGVLASAALRFIGGGNPR
jgi:hypothetical protein